MIEMDCTCSQNHHSIPTEVIEVSEHAIEKVPEILKNYHRIFLVADENTYEVAGRRVEELLKEAGNLSHSFVLPSPALPNAESIGRVLIEAGIEREVYDINLWSYNPDYIYLPDGQLSPGYSVRNRGNGPFHGRLCFRCGAASEREKEDRLQLFDRASYHHRPFDQCRSALSAPSKRCR